MLRKVKELSAEDKNAIIKLFEAAINRLEISKLGDKPTTTVYIFLKRYQQHGSIENASRSGSRSSLCNRDRNQIVRLVNTNRRSTLTEITNIINERTLENTERAITNGESRETDNTGYTTRRKTKQKHKMCWIPLYANKHK